MNVYLVNDVVEWFGLDTSPTESVADITPIYAYAFRYRLDGYAVQRCIKV